MLSVSNRVDLSKHENQTTPQWLESKCQGFRNSKKGASSRTKCERSSSFCIDWRFISRRNLNARITSQNKTEPADFRWVQSARQKRCFVGKCARFIKWSQEVPCAISSRMSQLRIWLGQMNPQAGQSLKVCSIKLRWSSCFLKSV